jgi:hypothetical protein
LKLPNKQKLKQQFGELEALHQLALLSGYETRVPTIDQFMTDPYYLGKSLVKDDGTLSVWPCWQKELREIFPNPYHITHAEVYATGGIGIGKSTFSKIATAYCICKILCLKNPHSYYDLMPTTVIQFALLNATLGLGYEVLYAELMDLFENSPFFKSNFNPTKETVFVKKIDLAFGSTGKHFLGKAVAMAIFSEINDATRVGQGQEMFTTIYQRLKSRFANKGKPLPGLIILDSSNKGNKSFVDIRIEEKTKNNDNDWKLIRLAGWDARWHFGGYSGNFFKVYAGDQHRDPFIFQDDIDESLISSLDAGRIIDVPVEHKQEFSLNIVEALRDMAGVSTFGTWSYIGSSEIIQSLFGHSNPVTKSSDIILDFFDEEDTLDKYLNVEHLTKMSSAPRFIHADLGIKTDSTGLACSFIAGYKDITSYDPVTGNEFLIRSPIVFNEWTLGIACKPGQEVPIYKIKNFLITAKQKGYPIAIVSTDGFQSTNLRQDLKLAGFETALISVDRTMDPYNALRDACLEGRCDLASDDIVAKEISELEQSSDGKKWDHSVGGCFTSETSIILFDKISNKRIIKQFSLLTEQDVNDYYVLGYMNNTFVLTDFEYPRITKHINEIIELVTDKGIIRCTLDHLVLTSDGYIKACDLTEDHDIISI